MAETVVSLSAAAQRDLANAISDSIRASLVPILGKIANERRSGTRTVTEDREHYARQASRAREVDAEVDRARRAVDRALSDIEKRSRDIDIVNKTLQEQGLAGRAFGSIHTISSAFGTITQNAEKVLDTALSRGKSAIAANDLLKNVLQGAKISGVERGIDAARELHDAMRMFESALRSIVRDSSIRLSGGTEKIVTLLEGTLAELPLALREQIQASGEMREYIEELRSGKDDAFSQEQEEKLYRVLSNSLSNLTTNTVVASDTVRRSAEEYSKNASLLEILNSTTKNFISSKLSATAAVAMFTQSLRAASGEWKLMAQYGTIGGGYKDFASMQIRAARIGLKASEFVEYDALYRQLALSADSDKEVWNRVNRLHDAFYAITGDNKQAVEVILQSQQMLRRSGLRGTDEQLNMMLEPFKKHLYPMGVTFQAYQSQMQELLESDMIRERIMASRSEKETQAIIKSTSFRIAELQAMGMLSEQALAASKALDSISSMHVIDRHRQATYAQALATNLGITGSGDIFRLIMRGDSSSRLAKILGEMKEAMAIDRRRAIESGNYGREKYLEEMGKEISGLIDAMEKSNIATQKNLQVELEKTANTEIMSANTSAIGTLTQAIDKLKTAITGSSLGLAAAAGGIMLMRGVGRGAFARIGTLAPAIAGTFAGRASSVGSIGKGAVKGMGIPAAGMLAGYLSEGAHARGNHALGYGLGVGSAALIGTAIGGTLGGLITLFTGGTGAASIPLLAKAGGALAGAGYGIWSENRKKEARESGYLQSDLQEGMTPTAGESPASKIWKNISAATAKIEEHTRLIERHSSNLVKLGELQVELAASSEENSRQQLRLNRLRQSTAWMRNYAY